MPDDLDPGRPAVEAVFVAFLTTAILGVAAVQVLATLLPPPVSEASPPTAVPLTLSVFFVSMAFAVAQAALPGPKSTGWFGLAIPLAGALALAFHGLDPAAIVSALLVGLFMTPAAYYLAIRLSFPLRGLLRHRPFSSLLGVVVGMFLLLYAARWMTFLADRAGRYPWR